MGTRTGTRKEKKTRSKSRERQLRKEMFDEELNVRRSWCRIPLGFWQILNYQIKRRLVIRFDVMLKSVSLYDIEQSNTMVAG